MAKRGSIELVYGNLWDEITDLFDINDELKAKIDDLDGEIVRLKEEIGDLEEELAYAVSEH